MQRLQRDSSSRGIRASIRTAQLAVCGGILALLAGCGDDPTAPEPPPPIDSPEAVVGALADAYRTLDFTRFESLVSMAPGARFTFHLAAPLPDGTTRWDPESELYVHQRMFGAGRQALEPPVPQDYWLGGITISLVPVAPFAEIANPPGLDPAHWRLAEATYQADILFDTQDATDYRASEEVKFAVLEDLAKSGSEPGRFLLYSIRELSEPAAMDRLPEPAGVEPVLWGRVKAHYAPESTPAALIAQLADAYRRRDSEAFAELFPEEGDDAEYYFYLYESLPDGTTSWDAAEEQRIHRRMFHPENVLPGETPVPMQYWLAAITISLTPIRDFVENPIYYYDETNNPEGLDPLQWRAVEAEYGAHVLFETASNDVDYLAVGRQNFVVLDRRDRLHGVPEDYVLYRWEDLGYLGRIASEASWSQLKSLYR